MSKSLKRTLQVTSELAAVAGIKLDELICFSFNGVSSPQFHLTPTALARVFRLFKVPGKTLSVTELNGNVHVSFKVRGANWRAVLLKEEVENWKRLAFAEAYKALSSRRPKLKGPAPSLIVQKTFELVPND